MEVKKLDIDSEVLARSVLEISDYNNGEDFASFEREFVRQYDPLYVTCKIGVEDIVKIHDIEAQDFRFLEVQMRLRGSLHKLYDVSGYDYNYAPVTEERDLEDVLEIA